MLFDLASDVTAILPMTVMQGIAVGGISMPRDLSVVAFNDIPDAARSNPPLTTVEGMGVEKGPAAARIVFARSPATRSCSPRLILRGSTAPTPK